MAAIRSHRRQCFTNTEEGPAPRKAPGHHSGHVALLQSRPPSGRGGAKNGDEEEVGEVILSEAQRQLQELLRKQLDTSGTTVKGALDRKKEFTPAVLYQPLSREVQGLRSLEQYQKSEEDHGQVDELRQMGLTAQEIELKLSEKGSCTDDGEPTAKRNKLEPHPKARQDRLQALHKKIAEKEQRFEEPVLYAGVKHMSRHAMEVERSLFRDSSGGNPLHHLTVQHNKRNNMAYPSEIMPTVSDGKDKEVATKASQSAVVPNEGVAAAMPLPLPVQVIERNRLTLAEILTLPRFRDYRSGEPSKVLYLKNLHPKVSEDDLAAVFGHFRARDGCPRVRVLVGRMRGQAFVEFDAVETATKALQLVNGYVMRGKPVIIAYGHADSSSGHADSSSGHGDSSSGRGDSSSGHADSSSGHADSSS